VKSLLGILEQIEDPGDLRGLKKDELVELAKEIRKLLMRVVANNGGHLASNLVVVELTLALHSVFNSPIDKIIWDVGHQSYVHKLLTGRREKILTLRRYGGISGFPKRNESIHDAYGTGHASTSISAALGMAQARDLEGKNYHVIAVIGDGALTGGMALEALNHAGDLKSKLIVVLNDNKMSIDSNIGAFSNYLNRLRTDPMYYKLKEDLEYILRRIPAIGEKMVKSAERLKDSFKYFLVPGMLFEELGFKYLGPVNGHNIDDLQAVFNSAKKLNGPVLIHVLTEKGKGYAFAEEEPNRFHGIGPFNPQNGLPHAKSPQIPTYTKVFSDTLVELAAKDKKIVAVTAAMAGGTGLFSFAERFPERFFDVGIAEQHACTFAGGLAASGFKPVIAIYSTFLQRAYDQILHDLCLQRLPVVLAIDRAGVVGEDGETHQGLFDYAYLRHIPGIVIMAPRNENELRHMLNTAISYKDGPIALRYPRGKGEGITLEEPQDLPIGRGELLRKGNDLLFLSSGAMAIPVMEAVERLFWQGINATVVNVRFIKPLDKELILSLASRIQRVITVEDHVLSGGFGSAVIELLEEAGLTNIAVRRLGFPDRFIEHGKREQILAKYGLDADGIYEAALNLCRQGVKHHQ
jgi:1-deoxy-D-xylulose-5-phosphate synthase